MISTTAQTLPIAQTLYAGGGFLTEDADLDAATGKVSAARDAAGLQTTLTYDSAGRLTHSTPPDTQATGYTYSAAGVTPGTVTAQTNSADSNAGKIATQNEYDPWGRPGTAPSRTHHGARRIGT